MKALSRFKRVLLFGLLVSALSAPASMGQTGVQRYMYRSVVKKSKTDLQSVLDQQKTNLEHKKADGHLLTCALFAHEGNLFLYYETVDREMRPSEVLPNLNRYLQQWPGEENEKHWTPMVDIFHGSVPVDVTHWRRTGSVGKRVGRLGRPWPDQVASYIYYHYQLQEERPANMRTGKYTLIGFDQPFIFYYGEEGSSADTLLVPRKLTTHNTPANWDLWQAIMRPHFKPWPEPFDFLRPMSCVLEL